MSKLDEFMAEIQAYDYKWFAEISGHEALAEIRALREQLNVEARIVWSSTNRETATRHRPRRGDEMRKDDGWQHSHNYCKSRLTKRT